LTLRVADTGSGADRFVDRDGVARPLAEESVGAIDPDGVRIVHQLTIRRAGDDERMARPVDRDIDVNISVAGVSLLGHLHLPESSRGVVHFAHGTGSSLDSPHRRLVADVLSGAGLGTFLLDLPAPSEENDHRFMSDIDVLAERLSAATEWVR
jgi:putative phosphoribosyl transferase